jgi:hypothetical protein
MEKLVLLQVWVYGGAGTIPGKKSHFDDNISHNITLITTSETSPNDVLEIRQITGRNSLRVALDILDNTLRSYLH